MTWSESCVIVYTNIANQGVQLEIKDAKLYVPVITLSIEDNEKLLSQLTPDFERTIKWNKYLTKPGLLRQSPDSNHLVEPKNRLFVLEFENDTQRTSSKRSSKCRNKSLQCYDWCKKIFWSANKK